MIENKNMQLHAFKSKETQISSFKFDELSGVCAKAKFALVSFPLSLSFVNPKGMSVYLPSFCLLVEHGLIFCVHR